MVDDEPTVRLLVTEALGDLGYRTVEAVDGAGAMAVLRSPARVDVLVADLGLPGGLGGRDVAEAGQALRPGLRVLFVTGYAEAAEGRPGPLDDRPVLAKPFAVEALAARVREVLDG